MIAIDLNTEPESIIGNIEVKEEYLNKLNEHINSYYEQYNKLPTIELEYAFIPKK